MVSKITLDAPLAGSYGRLWLALILSDLKCCGLQFISFILLALSVCVRNVSSTASSPHARHTPPELNCVDPNQIGLERYSLLLHSLTPRSMRGGLLSQFINADIFMPSFPPQYYHARAIDLIATITRSPGSNLHYLQRTVLPPSLPIICALPHPRLHYGSFLQLLSADSAQISPLLHRSIPSKPTHPLSPFVVFFSISKTPSLLSRACLRTGYQLTELGFVTTSVGCSIDLI